MSIIYLLLPITLIIAVLGLLAYIWSVKSGQLDDLDTPPLRMLFDDDEEPRSSQKEDHNLE